MTLRRLTFLAPLSLLAVTAAFASACTMKDSSIKEEPKAAPSASANAAKAAVAMPEPPKPPQIPAPADVAAPPADATTLPSGLASKVIAPGTGKTHPAPTDRVKVHYTGWKTDGEMFDSSVQRGEPITFGLNEVIKGWTEGVGLMVTGEKRRLWIPAAMAYGDHPRPGAPSGNLTFDVELLDITPAPKPPAVPEDVKAPPASAKKTASGLRYKVLKQGPGPKSPKATDTVVVDYSGWTTDGKMFDSSVMRGEKTTFPVNGVIPGWTEGLQLMKTGDKMRFWIPGNLAYGDTPKRPGMPFGMLVFDVELFEVK